MLRLRNLESLGTEAVIVMKVFRLDLAPNGFASAERGADSPHAQITDDPKRNDARPGSLQADRHGLKPTGFPLKVVFALDFQDSCCTLCWADFARRF